MQVTTMHMGFLFPEYPSEEKIRFAIKSFAQERKKLNDVFPKVVTKIKIAPTFWPCNKIICGGWRMAFDQKLNYALTKEEFQKALSEET